MDNTQIPKADSKFQKIARKNHRKWKMRLLSKGGQKADSGGSPYKKKPDYNRAKSAPPGFGGSMEESEQLNEIIRKKDGKYCLFSKKTKRNLGCYPTKAGAMKREKQVQYFKHLKENLIQEELEKALLEEGILGTLGSALGLTGDKKEEEPEKKEPEKQQVGKKALVFGHSQSGGMGLDFVKILKGQGYDVTRVTKVGAGDRQLGSMIPSETGDPAQYEKVFYFAGANMPGPPGTITANVNKLGGPSKVTVILAPYNMSKEPPDLLSDPNTKGYRNEQELKSAGIRVYRPLFPSDIFWGDRVHVKPGTSIGMEFANDVISGRDNKYSNPSTAKAISTDFLSDLKKAITSSEIYKTLKGFFTSKKTGALDSSEGLMKFKAHLNTKQDEMADLIYNEFTSAGLGPNIALAAIVNAYKESALNPNAVGDRGHSVGLFQLHDRGGGSGMSVEERKDPVINTQKIIKIVKGGFGRKLRVADEQGKSVPVLAAIFSRDVERPADKEGNMIARSKQASSWLGIDNVVDQSNVDQVDTMVAESKKKGKDDRCVRIAKRKYKAWPSAYASGAVVKCRQGKIWKGVSEGTEELDEDKKLKRNLKKGIASALASMTAVLPPPDSMKPVKSKKPSEVIKKDKEELEEEWSQSERSKRKSKCSNPKGFTMKQFCKNQRTRSKSGEKTNEEVELDERKLGKPSSETNLGDWFKRKGAPGKKGGWVDCNTCRDGKCKPCGRQSGEERSKYPRCRPTPAQCKGYKRRGSNLQREEE